MTTDLPRPTYGSDLTIWMMRQMGIPYIALNTGSSFKWLQDSMVNYTGNQSPELIQCTHEEVSVAIAHAYAKATGKPMVAACHNVVGLQHATMAIYNAYTDRAPVIVVGGTGPMDATTRRPGIDWLHTALVQGDLVRGYVKWDDQPHSVAAIPDSFLRGYQIASMHPQGPVYICYDATLQAELIGEKLELPMIGRYTTPTLMGPDPEAIRTLATWLVEAQNPLVVADHAGKDPQVVEALLELAELLALPVADRGGRYNFPSTHPLDVSGQEIELMKDRDLVLVLESRDIFGLFHQRSLQNWQTEPFIPASCKVASISMWDMRGGGWNQDYQRIAPLDLNIAADTTVTLPMLVEECKRLVSNRSKTRYERRATAIRQLHLEAKERWLRQAKEGWNSSPVSTGRLALDVWDAIKNEDWVLGNGNLAGWSRRLWDFSKPYQHLGGSGGGGLGYGYPAAIGAALAHRTTDRVILNIQSDGDLMYTPGAIWTAAHHKLPILTVMFNNRNLFNSDEHARQVANQRSRPVERRSIGVWMDDPPVDYAKLAEAQGVFGIGPITQPDKIAPALKQALKMVKEERLPALVDIVCQDR
ncbi:MAG: thiamine pyrophosphate-binding protein [Chloroflexi bacterium]|nr:thiamine pyrophosphate-binding protein [Chloroflexota bacterium]